MNKSHLLKILPAYFADVKHGIKTFEIRKNDRGYQVGDDLVLKEIDQFTLDYTGRELRVRVVYKIDDAEYCKEGYVVLGIQKVGDHA